MRSENTKERRRGNNKSVLTYFYRRFISLGSLLVCHPHPHRSPAPACATISLSRKISISLVFNSSSLFWAMAPLSLLCSLSMSTLNVSILSSFRSRWSLRERRSSSTCCFSTVISLSRSLRCCCSSVIRWSLLLLSLFMIPISCEVSGRLLGRC